MSDYGTFRDEQAGDAERHRREEAGFLGEHIRSLRQVAKQEPGMIAAGTIRRRIRIFARDGLEVVRAARELGQGDLAALGEFEQNARHLASSINFHTDSTGPFDAMVGAEPALASMVSYVDNHVGAFGADKAAAWAPSRARVLADLELVASLTDIDDTLTRTLAEAAESISQAKLATTQAEEAATIAKTSAELARQAAGESGTSALQKEFEAFSVKHDTTAGRFRAATIALLAAVILVAGAFTWMTVFSNRHPEATNWETAVSHLALLSGFAAVAAYLARQATHYRRAALWAAGIAVQLRTWDAFIEPLDDDATRASLYEIFGRRVLGPPPEITGGQSEGTNPLLGPIIDLIAKQSPPSGK